MAFKATGRRGFYGTMQGLFAQPDATPREWLMAGQTLPQQGLFAPGAKPRASLKLDAMQPPAASGDEYANETAKLARQDASGMPTPIGDAAPQDAAAGGASGQDRFMALLNNPMFQFGMNLLGSSTQRMPWASALQGTLAAQMQAAQAARLQQQAELEKQRVGIEQQRANQDYELGARRAAIGEGEYGLRQREYDEGAGQRAAQLGLTQAQTGRMASQSELERQQLLMEQQKMQRQQQFLDQIGGVLGGGLFSQPQAGGASLVPQQDARAGAMMGEQPIGHYGTPAWLLDNLRQVESSGNPNAVNPQSGATGAYQFMPATVQMLAKQGMQFDPRDPNASRDAADFYLQQLVKQNGGDYSRALAAYGGFKSKDPTPYINKVANGMPLPSAPANAQGPQPVPNQAMTGDAGMRVAQAGTLAALGGLQGGPQLMELGKMMQPQTVAPGSYQRDPTTGQMTFTQDPYKEQSLAMDRQRLSNESAKTAQELKNETAKQAQTQADATQSYQNITNSMQRLAQNADALLKHPGLESNTGLSGVLGVYKATQPGRDAAAMLDTLKNKMVVSTLADLKRASANGSSGFGQLSDTEGQRLENYVVNLSRAQSLPQMQAALKDLKEFAQGATERYTQHYNSLYGNSKSPNVAPSIGAQPQSAAPPAAAMSLDQYLQAKRGNRTDTPISSREAAGRIKY